MTFYHTAETEEYYNNLANTYDEVTSNGAWSCPKNVSTVVGNQDYESILIIGVGTGKDISELERLVNIKYLEGIDVSEKM